MDAPLPSPAEWRDWAGLPSNIMCAILSRLPQADILREAGVGLACKSWRRAAVEEDLLWRRIDLAAPEDADRDAPAGWKDMAQAAVDRSAGRCESYRGRADADFLIYLGDSAPSLRSLHGTSALYRGEGDLVTAAIKKLPLLEQLVLSRGIVKKEWLVALLEHCPRLELLDAGGCVALELIGKRLVERCESRIGKGLRWPQRGDGVCPCCAMRAQIYVDEHDE
ncbi:hypothetical protein ACQJBY_053742 [Aegilops geniculata]